MSVSEQMPLYGFQCCPHSFVMGFPDDGKISVCSFHSTVEGKACKVEGFMSSQSPSLPVLSGVVLELDQSGFVLVQV